MCGAKISVNDVLTYILIFFLVVLICYTIVYIIRITNQAPSKKEGFNQEETTPRHKIVGLFMNGCGYCTRFHPVFESVIKQKASEPSFSKNWSVIQETDTNVARTKYGVSSFPAVLIFKNNSEHATDMKIGSMNADEFSAFIDKAMAD